MTDPSGRRFRITFYEALATLLLLMIVGQFTLAGLSMFVDGSTWDFHRNFGFSMQFVVAALFLTTLFVRRYRRYAVLVTIITVLFVMQVLSAIYGSSFNAPYLMAFHLANAGLLMLASSHFLSRLYLSPQAETPFRTG